PCYSSLTLRPPSSTLFPYTTLFRSLLSVATVVVLYPPWWWVVPAAFLVFDLSVLGYARSPATGATSYNLVHNYAAPALLGLVALDRKSTRLNSSHVKISYAVFCLKK